MQNTSFRIKENSWLAKAAAYKLKSNNAAIVFGNTIHLYGVTKNDFLQNEKWLKHELCHVQQFRQHGCFPFIAKYIVESIRKGYYNNKYEVEARLAEEL